MRSRAAPAPPGRRATKCARASTSGRALAGAAAKPQARSMGRSTRSSPMQQASAAATPASRRTSAKASPLRSMPWRTKSILRSRARAASDCETRLVMTPVSRPARRASMMPMPSWALKPLTSTRRWAERGKYQMVPSVRTPSTSNSRRRMRRARARASRARMGAEGMRGESEQLRGPEIVEVNQAGEAAVALDDQQRRDFALLHEAQRGGGELGGGDGDGLTGHVGFRRHLERLRAMAFEQAAEVAIRDDAEEAAVGVEHGGDAEALAAHFIEDVVEAGGGGDDGQFVAFVHQLGDRGEALAQAAAGMEGGEALGAEAFFLGQRHGQGVAQGEHGGGRGSGRQAQGAGFRFDADVEHGVGGARQRRLRRAGHGDQRQAHAADRAEEVEQLFGVA